MDDRCAERCDKCGSDGADRVWWRLRLCPECEEARFRGEEEWWAWQYAHAFAWSTSLELAPCHSDKVSATRNRLWRYNEP